MRSGEAPRGRPTGGARGYALLDAGDGRRLERFGSLVLDRPAPGATDRRREPARWLDADLRFDPGRGWSGRAAPADPWEVEIDGLVIELRPTSSGGLGLYPEHLANLAWLDAEVRARLAHGRRVTVLNLFAHTGLATLAAARAGAAVTHVDAARASVAWARRNAERNGLAEGEIRWLVDDAQAFVDREARRGHRYAGVILDPPSAGHGRAGRWTLRDDLPRLLAACAAIAADDAFVLLTAHTTGVSGEALGAMLHEAFPRRGERPQVAALTMRTESGATLGLGWAVRFGTARQSATARVGPADGTSAPDAAP
ncbi:MAG TPA: class I SAM-dependent methyltransferase [Candidatus Limnocylindrales bacterium]|nr:class I SAM-dependent methyltransferase [Candidatus Limnocylindrales bacterium]